MLLFPPSAACQKKTRPVIFRNRAPAYHPYGLVFCEQFS